MLFRSKLGSVTGEPFVGMSYGHQRDYSEEIAAIVDEEVRSLIDTAHQEAYEILVENREILDNLVVELMEKETLEKEEVAQVFAGVKKFPARKPWTGSKERKPSKKPPVVIDKANEEQE